MCQREVTEIYEKIQAWLGGQETGDLKTGNLIFELPPAEEGGTPRLMRFRRQILMGGHSRAVSMEDDAVWIPYDPCWESIRKIERLAAKLTEPAKEGVGA